MTDSLVKDIDPRIPGLPSLNELLGHPSVQAVVERLNQTTVAQRATGFLEELREGLLERSEKGLIPTAEQLAERFARHLLGVKSHRQQVINATGVVGGVSSLALPLAEAALHQVMYSASEYHRVDPSLQQRAVELLCRVTSAEAAWIVSSFPEAVSRCSLTDAQVAIAPHAGILDPAEWGLESVPPIASRLQEADVVVLDGAGLLGGPTCGIIVGRQSTISQLSGASGAEHREVDALRLTALAATLEIYLADDRVIHQIPVLQLLSTPLENLRQRCERLAPLLEQVDAVTSATAQQRDSVWWQGGGKQWRGPSWVISLETRQQSAETIANSLAECIPSLLATVENEQLCLDLRSVFPRWDQQLVAALEGLIG